MLNDVLFFCAGHDIGLGLDTDLDPVGGNPEVHTAKDPAPDQSKWWAIIFVAKVIWIERIKNFEKKIFFNFIFHPNQDNNVTNMQGVTGCERMSKNQKNKILL